MPNRYYIDERVGCMAVRDREQDAPKDEEPGLWPDTTGVVSYFSGSIKIKACPTCGHRLSQNYVPDFVRAAAVAECKRWNDEDSP